MYRDYIGTERQLAGPTLTKQEAATLVVDELLVAWKRFRHTKLKSDLLLFIERALYLQQLGFQLVLDRKHECVGAHAKTCQPKAPNVNLPHICDVRIGPKGGAYVGASERVKPD